MLTQVSSRLFFAAGLCLVVLCIQPRSMADIIANFDDGNTTAEVDGYKGKAGDGWTSEWKTSGNGGALTDSTTISNSDPLAEDSGNYLDFIINRQSGATGGLNARVYRQYDTFDPMFAKEYTISFDFRLNSTTSEMSNIFLFDGKKSNTNAVVGGSNENTWVINIYGGKIFYYDGTSQKDTEISIVQGDAFRFTINVNPANETYTLEFVNLDHSGTSYTSGVIAFNTSTSGVNPNGGWLTFQGNLASAASSTSFSIDNIAIVPEPATVALLSISILSIFGLVFRRRK